MARGRPAASGYARLAQAEEEEEDIDDSEEERTLSSQHFAPIQPGPRSLEDSLIQTEHKRRRRKPRSRANSTGVDIKALNARLERWAEEIASKFKIRRIKGKSSDEEKLEIHHSVFTPPEGMRPANAETLAGQYAEDPASRLTKLQFDDIVESVKVAIELGVHPKLITQGSSGSYFARNSEGTVVGVFKPKDEEPYASRNPKWTKWIHRNLFPFFFGRACLIPNLSYVSEAAAYVLDVRLQTNIVPYTDVVYMSSHSFFYDYWERRNYYRKKKPLPQKPGSFQVFLNGYQDATKFLKVHPWPDQVGSYSAADESRRGRRRRWADNCRPSGEASDDEDDDAGQETSRPSSSRPASRQRKQFWTDELQQSFREELEKLVVLDYIMRNTDRGLDNWMIKIDTEAQKASIVADPFDDSQAGDPYGRRSAMSSSSATGEKPRVHIGAIDNSLSWPWKHPDAWRSYPFGWLFLPVSLIGRPFSQNTRDHFLPLLTSKQWWSDTQVALRNVFAQDSDFKERMFARQIAVMKGQAWNVVETLKQPDHGPLELTRRARVCVWDDLVEIPVAVPLRSTTADVTQQLQQDARQDTSEEMDLGQAPAPKALGPLPSPNKFSLSRSRSPQPHAHAHLSTSAVPTLDENTTLVPTGELTLDKRGHPKRPDLRISLDERRPRLFHRERRNLSFSARRMSDHDASEAEDDGDLGFAVARDHEGNRKKVIVERLEMVKSKPPVFTWC